MYACYCNSILFNLICTFTCCFVGRTVPVVNFYAKNLQLYLDSQFRRYVLHTYVHACVKNKSCLHKLLFILFVIHTHICMYVCMYTYVCIRMYICSLVESTYAPNFYHYNVQIYSFYAQILSLFSIYN